MARLESLSCANRLLLAEIQRRRAVPLLPDGLLSQNNHDRRHTKNRNAETTSVVVATVIALTQLIPHVQLTSYRKYPWPGSQVHSRPAPRHVSISR